MFDYLIRNAMLVDGTGAPAERGDLAIQGGKIAAVGCLPHASAAQVLDARGMYLTPGFLDIHRHADDALFRPGFGRAELAQGLTTIVNGNCGLSLAPVPAARRPEIYGYLTPVTGLPAEELPTQTMQAYLDAVGAAVLPLNVGMLVGGGTVRAAAAGFSGAAGQRRASCGTPPDRAEPFRRRARRVARAWLCAGDLLYDTAAH